MKTEQLSKLVVLADSQANVEDDSGMISEIKLGVRSTDGALGYWLGGVWHWIGGESVSLPISPAEVYDPQTVGFDTYTKSLLHFNGEDGATTFPDEVGKIWTAHGNVQIDASQSVFGGASALFDGSGDYLSTPDHADFNFGADDFTVDFRVRFAASGFQCIAGQFATGNKGWIAYVRTGFDALVFQYTTNGTTDISKTFSWTPSLDTWYHIEYSRNGANLRVFVNGTQVGSTVNIGTDVIFNSTANLIIGQSGAGDGFLNGWLDEFRISNGIARHTANFSIETAEYEGITDPQLNVPTVDKSASVEGNIPQWGSVDGRLTAGLDVVASVGNPGTDTNIPTEKAVRSLLSSVGVDDTAYASSWDGDTTHAPSKNAVFDKINSMNSGSGDVTGPSSATDGHLAVFDGTDGKKIKDGGAVPSGSSNVIGQSGTETTVANSTSETTVYTGPTITGGTIGANGSLRLTVGFDLRHDTVCTTTIRVKLGTTVVATVGYAQGSTDALKPSFMEIIIANLNSQSSQRYWIHIWYRDGSDKWFRTTGTAAADTSGNLQLTMTVQHSAANANNYYKQYYLAVEKL
jgi:hypothetical protein